ncbi:MAG: TetR/AcrR family transcriptional regulator [Pseudomonadota bacterium]
MARPQAADYYDRRAAVLAKAAELYASRGFHGCSISDLAAACGMSKSLLYHYFSSKEDILFEIMESHVADLSEVIKEANAIEYPRERFSAQLHGFMRLYRNAVHHHKVLVNDLDKLPPERAAHIIKTERAIIASLAASLAALAPDMAKDEARLKAVTMLFFGMINWTHTWFKPGEPLETDDLADLAEQLLLGGLSSAGPKPLS